MLVGIMIDAYKLAIFERHLTDEGYTFTTKKYSKGMLLLQVEGEPSELRPIIDAANKEAKSS